jgi:hypothetical protein
VANPLPLRPYNIEPRDESLSFATNDFLKWVQTALNTLIGQQVPQTPGLQALAPSVIDPSAANLILSVGNRVSSIVTSIKWSATTTSITFYWDGTNGSQILTAYRDDGTTQVLAAGNLTVTGLSANTTYYFYPFYQESVIGGDNIGGETVGVHFASMSGVSVGMPGVAFTSQNVQAAHKQNLRDHLALALILATTGAATPASGTSAGSGGTGGGGGNSGGFGRLLP